MLTMVLGGLLSITLSACGAADSSSNGKDAPIEIAVLSFAAGNSYDAPMLDAARVRATELGANLTIYDAENNPQKQFTQLQNVLAQGDKYQGIFVQPILSTGLIPLVEQAIAAGIKVVAVDTILGPDQTTNAIQVDGLSASILITPDQLGVEVAGQVIAACQEAKADPCKVGYIYAVKASTLDIATREGFDKTVSNSPIEVVAEGESFYTIPGGLEAADNMLTAHPDLDVIVGSDQGILGAEKSLEKTKGTSRPLLVGWGGSESAVARVASGAWFSTYFEVPATEGRLGVEALVTAVRDGKDLGAIDPLADVPNNAIVTKETADQFKPEWKG